MPLLCLLAGLLAMTALCSPSHAGDAAAHGHGRGHGARSGVEHVHQEPDHQQPGHHKGSHTPDHCLHGAPLRSAPTTGEGFLAAAAPPAAALALVVTPVRTRAPPLHAHRPRRTLSGREALLVICRWRI